MRRTLHQHAIIMNKNVYINCCVQLKSIISIFVLNIKWLFNWNFQNESKIGKSRRFIRCFANKKNFNFSLKFHFADLLVRAHRRCLHFSWRDNHREGNRKSAGQSVPTRCVLWSENAQASDSFNAANLISISNFQVSIHCCAQTTRTVTTHFCIAAICSTLVWTTCIQDSRQSPAQSIIQPFRPSTTQHSTIQDVFYSTGKPMVQQLDSQILTSTLISELQQKKLKILFKMKRNVK